MSDYIKLEDIRKNYFVHITQYGYRPAYRNGANAIGYFYTQRPETIFSDIYRTYEEAEKQLELRIGEEPEPKKHPTIEGVK